MNTGSLSMISLICTLLFIGFAASRQLEPHILTGYYAANWPDTPTHYIDTSIGIDFENQRVLFQMIDSKELRTKTETWVNTSLTGCTKFSVTSDRWFNSLSSCDDVDMCVLSCSVSYTEHLATPLYGVVDIELYEEAIFDYDGYISEMFTVFGSKNSPYSVNFVVSAVSCVNPDISYFERLC